MGAAARPAALAAPPSRPSLGTLAWIALAELLLPLLGWKLGSLAWPLAGALAVVFAVVAYRAPEVAWILVWMATPFSREIVVAGGAPVSLPPTPLWAPPH